MCDIRNVTTFSSLKTHICELEKNVTEIKPFKFCSLSRKLLRKNVWSTDNRNSFFSKANPQNCILGPQNASLVFAICQLSNLGQAEKLPEYPVTLFVKENFTRLCRSPFNSEVLNLKQPEFHCPEWSTLFESSDYCNSFLSALPEFSKVLFKPSPIRFLEKL